MKQHQTSHTRYHINLKQTVSLLFFSYILFYLHSTFHQEETEELLLSINILFVLLLYVYLLILLFRVVLFHGIDFYLLFELFRMQMEMQYLAVLERNSLLPGLKMRKQRSEMEKRIRNLEMLLDEMKFPLSTSPDEVLKEHQ